MANINPFVLLLLLTLTGTPLRGQERIPPDDVLSGLQEKLSAYSVANPTSNLYLHLDKTIYSPEETIWFKAYVLGDTSQQARVLYVRIVDEEKTVVAEAQFPMYDVRAHGSIALYAPGNSRILGFGGLYAEPPRMLIDGIYTLYAYTDQMIALNDTNVFVQPIRIGRATGGRLEATASVTDTAMLFSGGQVQIKVDVKESGNRAGGVKGEYLLLSGVKELKYGQLTTNTFGEAFINFTYPDLSELESLNVKLLFMQGNDQAELLLNLLHRTTSLIVNCLSESGSAVPGGRIAVEVLDLVGNPVRTSLQVTDGDSIVANVTTDSLDMAIIDLPELAGVRYTIKTLDGRGQTLYEVPSGDRLAGFSLKLQHDSTRSIAVIRNHGPDSTAQVVLRSNSEVLWRIKKEVLPGDSVMITVPAEQYPKDVLSLAVFDKEDVLNAERLFLNKEKEDYHVSINMQQEVYGVKKRVTVTMRATDDWGNPVIANFSVSATEKNRFEGLYSRGILREWQLRGLDLQKKQKVSIGTRAALNNLLIGRFWYRSPKKGLAIPAANHLSSGNYGVNGVTGIVVSVNFPKDLRYAVPVRRKVKEVRARALEDLSIQKDKLSPSYLLRTFQVNQQDNSFFIPDSLLLSRKVREWSLRIPEKGPFHPLYMIDWRNPDMRFDSLIINGGQVAKLELTNQFGKGKLIKQSGFDFHGTNLLDEVVIGAKEKVRPRTLKRTNCQCYHDMLVDDLKAKESVSVAHGWSYLKQGMTHPFGFTLDREPRLIVYLGCGRYRDINYIKNITIPEDFPLPDYEANPITELDMRSTVYWNPNIYTDADGMATFSFFTSDVTGEFEIVAQGLDASTLRPLMGTGSFKVVNR